MKKIYLLLCLFPIFIHAQVTGVVNWRYEELSFEKYSQYDKIVYGNNYSSEIGKPELPVCIQSWVVPVNAEITGIDKTVTGKNKLSGSYFVFPVQPPVPVNGQMSSDTFFEPDSIIYNSIVPFPGEQIKVISDRFVMGYHVVTVEISPLEYIPLARELYLCDVSYTINYRIVNDDSSSNMTPAKQTPLRREMIKSHIASMVQNPEDVDNYAPLKSIKNHRIGFSENKLMRTIAIDEERIPDYIIITNETLKPEFQRLADWKTKKGIPALIKTVEEIAQDYTGCGLQEKIRNYLLAVKNRWGEGIFVLLGGDTNIVPSKIVIGDENMLRPGDLYYNSSTITWDPFTNKFEELPERKGDFIFYMGRASVEDFPEAKIFIDKVIQYEKLLANIDYSYFNNFLAVDAYLDKYPGTNKLISGAMKNINEFFYKYTKENIKKWYQFDHFACSSNTDHEIHKYAGTHGEELDKSHFLAALNAGGNSGLNHFHFVYHMDHSSPSTMGSSFTDKNEMIINVDVDNLSNGNYFQIIMSGGCEPADFSKDCIAERFLNNPNGGAVAFIGNSDQGWSDEWLEFQYFMEALFMESNNMHQYSIALPFQKSYAGISTTLRFTYWRFHLLGDPEMPVWTDTPKNLAVEITPDTIVNGVNTIRVRINNLPSNQQALICLMKGTEGYATLTVEDTNWHEFTFTPQTAGVVDVTVTAHNFRPFERSVPVTVNDHSMVYVSNLTFDDDRSGTSRGNGDGQLDAGETVELAVELKNGGNSVANHVKAVLSCNSPDIRILNDTVTYGTIAANGNKVPVAKFVFKIDSLSAEYVKNDLNPVKFYLDIQEDAGSRIESFNIDIFVPELELRNQRIVSTSNGDLQVGPNETVAFTIDLMNMGKAVATGVRGKLSANSPYVAACSAVQKVYPDIAKYETATNSVAYQFTTTNNYVVGAPLLFKLEIENEYGRKWTFDVDPVSKPARVALSTMGFRSYETEIDIFWNEIIGVSGYNIYRSEDGTSSSYQQLNKFPLPSAYFKDETAEVYSAYYYKVTAISDKGNEGELGDPLKAWTTCKSIGLFPLPVSDPYSITGSINVADVNNDGKKEIFLSKLNRTSREGYVLGIDTDGRDLFDIDGNVTTFSGFAKLSTMVCAAPAIGDLNGDGEQNIVAVTWDDTYLERNSVSCFASRDNNQDHLPDLLWKTDIPSSCYRSPVVANVDNSADGSMEVIIRSNSSGPIRILDCNGQERYSFGQGSTYAALAVADLDNDGDMEIIACYNGVGMCIWHHDGTPFSTNPVFNNGETLSSPVVCDLDGDGRKEIILTDKKTVLSHIYVIRPDGSGPVSGWNGTQSIPYTINSIDHGLSVGDIDNDGRLEVVALGKGVVKAWNSEGTELFSRKIIDLFQDVQWEPNKNVPILADVDGDSVAEIIFGTKKEFYALHNDGSDVVGFPMRMEIPFLGSACVADIDNDGKNELIAADNHTIYAWKTEGSADCIEWGSERCNPQNTGEYGKVCVPLVVRGPKIWDATDNACGNIVLESGTLMVGSTSLAMNPSSTLIIRSGATLVVDGGNILNANIKALRGSKIIVKNNGRIQLRDAGSFNMEQGAELDYQYGNIDVTD